MIVFPNSKINLGLSVTKKRPDGFHDLQTVFYPVNWCDAHEVIAHEDPAQPFLYSQSGLAIEGPPENNLIYKAWVLLKENYQLPPLRVHLHKNIPMGAGLGGGSSDCAFFITLLQEMCSLGMDEKKKTAIASQLGSDCAFFLQNKPAFGEGRGDELKPVALDLSSCFILIVYPGFHSDTREAFSGIVPKKPDADLKKTVLKKAIREWKEVLVNDFEASVSAKHPVIADVKDDMYQAGALYASLSGSGSAVYGIFDFEPDISFCRSFLYYLQKPTLKIL